MRVRSLEGCAEEEISWLNNGVTRLNGLIEAVEAWAMTVEVAQESLKIDLAIRYD